MTETAFTWSAPHSDDRYVRRPLRPGADPFYDAPDGLASLAHGAVIRSRQVRLGFLGLGAQRSLNAWQLAYRSTDLDGAPEVAVTTVVVPGSHDPSRPQRLVATNARSSPSPTVASRPTRCAPALGPGERCRNSS